MPSAGTGTGSRPSAAGSASLAYLATARRTIAPTNWSWESWFAFLGFFSRAAAFVATIADPSPSFFAASLPASEGPA